MKQSAKIRPSRSLFALLCALLLALSACDSATPQAPTSELEAQNAGFAFRVDPKAKTVVPVESMFTDQLQAQADSGDARLLVQGQDIRFKDFSFQFKSPNKLTVRLRVENITGDLDFVQPFFFTLSSTSRNIVKATAPLVTDQKLGGDGVLSPGETSKRFPFRVTFKENEPFTFFVDANAVVQKSSACVSPVVIPDDTLETALREALGKSEGALTCEDLASLERLDTQGVDSVFSLEGLQFAVNLTALNLDLNEVSDLGPLAGLVNLETLLLGGNNISDISPLANLTNLQDLRLDVNDISDIGPLANLTKLTNLRLTDNAIGDLSPLRGLTSLEDLQIEDNEVSDLSPLEGLTTLERVSLEDNDISEIGALVNNVGLSSGDAVFLSGNPLSDQALEDVETLRARGVIVGL